MNKKAFLLYFFIIVIFGFLVVAKQKAITKKNLKEPVTFYSSWKEHGKPVIVRKIQKSDLQENLKITLHCESENIYVGYLPKIYIKGLSNASIPLIQYEGKKIPCKILEIATTVDFDSGMYPIKILCSEKLNGNIKKYFAEIAVPGLSNVVILPHDCINLEDNRSFVWVIENGKAHKKFITLQERCFNGVAAQGIGDKELIIISGLASLKENDLVNFNYEN